MAVFYTPLVDPPPHPLLPCGAPVVWRLVPLWKTENGLFASRGCETSAQMGLRSLRMYVSLDKVRGLGWVKLLDGSFVLHSMYFISYITAFIFVFRFLSVFYLCFTCVFICVNTFVITCVFDSVINCVIACVITCFIACFNLCYYRCLYLFNYLSLYLCYDL